MIDVIIPSYNRGHLIQRSVESVLRQTFQDFNLYVVDDGSTDETSAKLTPFLAHPRFHFLRQENKGVSAARNFGIRSSRAPWVALLDSDDEWLPKKLEAQVRFSEGAPDRRFIHTDETWIRNGVRVNPRTKFDKSNRDLFNRSLETCLISPSTTLIKRSLFSDFGLFDEEFVVCEDYDLWLRVLAREEVAFLPENLVTKYGGHADQLSADPFLDYWRIRSLVKLLSEVHLDPEKKSNVLLTLHKKIPSLIAGLQKHNHLTKMREVIFMRDGLKYLMK